MLTSRTQPSQVDVAVFATLLFLITIGFGFAFFTLLPTRVAAAPGAEFFLGSHPLWDSWWGLFGDYDRGTIYAQGACAARSAPRLLHDDAPTPHRRASLFPPPWLTLRASCTRA